VVAGTSRDRTLLVIAVAEAGDHVSLAASTEVLWIGPEVGFISLARESVGHVARSLGVSDGRLLLGQCLRVEFGGDVYASVGMLVVLDLLLG